MHYRRWQRHGDPLVNFRPEQVIGTPEERFWPKVDKAGECWSWTANCLPSGYGVFSRGGRRGTMLAHRFAYELANGPIPEGVTIDHLCHTPGCVRAEHLEAVSQAVNNGRARGNQFQRNAAKTHCPKGHPYDAANTILRTRKKDGGISRECRACLYEAVKRYKAKQKATSFLSGTG